MEESYDITVIGAGWFGLAAAKAYHQMHPQEKVAVLESAESCGGTWSKSRLYPGLKSNNMIGTYEYPDFPMSEDKYGVGPFNHIPAAVLHQYLTDFAHHFNVFDKIQFSTQVDVVEPHQDGGWRIHVTTPMGQRVVKTAKLILATGLTSTPNMPHYNKEESFDAPLFHAKDFCQEAPNLKDIKNAVVVGGAKSAYDVAYALVEDGATVDLVIRPDGHGPVWIAPPIVTPFKKRLDKLLHVRWMTWFSPCPWGAEDGWSGIRNFLHGTAIGRGIVNQFWKTLGADVVTANDYDSDPELAKLKPWNSVFWIGSGLSILNYRTSLFDLVKQGKIRVHIDNIDHLEPKKVVLCGGQTLRADVMVCSTGWKKESPIKFRGLGEEGFGLPFSEAEKQALNEKTDHEVLTRYPVLKDQPQLKFEPKKADPLRLYRFMVPSTYVDRRTIAFAGAVSTVSTSICATLQGQWISTYMGGNLDRLPESREEITDEIMLHTQWGKWRFPCGYGASLPDFVFEALPYTNLLLRDMGIKDRRKNGLIQELFSPYTPGDFAGLVEEWQGSHAAGEKV
ncbi:hypothetical protein F5Y15DRAFT_216524 [Xylariaceae sp. FL0016]|nr:hypothetical protein F5Y15DRAFT_216524 [Xylariaceae sp. FL0016]